MEKKSNTVIELRRKKSPRRKEKDVIKDDEVKVYTWTLIRKSGDIAKAFTY